MKTTYLHFYLIVISLICFGCQTKPSNSSNELEERFISSTISNPNIISDKNYTIFLPKKYHQNQDKQYPVLYMMDAQNLFIDSLAYGGFSWRIDQVVDSLVDKNQIEEIIIVAVEHAGINRFSEYMPQKPMVNAPQVFKDSIISSMNAPIYSDQFLVFLTKHLKPIIDKNYRTKTDVDHTFIGGSSMGGLISMYALCEYPAIFGGAMCLSTHWIITFDDSFPEASKTLVDYFSQNLPAQKKWYFDFGTKGLDQYYEPWQNQIDSILEKSNYVKNKNWKTLIYEGHDHNERFWNSRVDIPLKLLFGKE